MKACKYILVIHGGSSSGSVAELQPNGAYKFIGTFSDVETAKLTVDHLNDVDDLQTLEIQNET
jgi:hypothetical protein